MLVLLAAATKILAVEAATSIHLASLPNPWSEAVVNPYPPASLLPFMLFDFLSEWLQVPRLGILLYLLTMIAAIVLAVWMASRPLSLSLRMILVGAVALASPPVISSLDRGNSVGFIAPLLLVFFSSIRNNSTIGVVLSITALTVIKPHLGLLVLIPVLRKDHVSAIKILGLIGTIQLTVALTFWGHLSPNLFFQVFNQVIGFQNYSSITTPWPPTISFAHGLYSMTFAVDRLSPWDLSPLLNLLDSNAGILGAAVLASTVIMLGLTRNLIGRLESAIILTAAIIMTSSTTYFYYSIFCVATFTVLASVPAKREFESPMQRNNFVAFTLLAASLFSLIQFPIPGFQEGQILLTSASLIPVAWMTAIAASFAIVLVPISNSRKNKIQIIQ
jgi:hypothetical protein